jgi:glutathione S-transferase
MFANPALKIYALVTAILGIHLYLLAGYTGAVRNRHKSSVNPEDTAVHKGATAEIDHPAVARVKRAHLNAMENALPFFAVGLMYAFSAPSDTGAYAYYFTFLGARLLHSIFYLTGKQPFRTITFAVGALAVIGMAVHVIRATI